MDNGNGAEPQRAAGQRAATQRVVCAGQVVVDLFVPPLTALPAPGELVASGDMLSDVGGCSANTATVLAKLGVPTLLSALVGDDSPGEWARRILHDQGLDTRALLTSGGAATSQTVILPVIGDDRRYIHSPGANMRYTADLAAAHLDGAEILVLGGFLSLPGLTGAGVSALFAQARRAGVRTVLDVVIPRGTTDAAETLRGVLPFVDCFTPNDDEAAVLTGERDPERQAQILLGWGCRSVTITCGPLGAVFADHERTVRVPAPPTEFVDGSGAGDAFTAGLVYGMLHDWDIDRRLRFATVLGASVTRGLGTTRTLCTLDEALASIDRVPLEPSH